MTTNIDLDRLALTVERDGVDAIDLPTLRRLATLALSVGLHPDVVALLSDGAAPGVVRQRAFGHLARRISGGGGDRTPRPAPLAA